MGKNEKNILYYPMIVVVAYLTITMLLFAIGPIEWPVDNEFSLYMFLTLYIVAFIVGYIKGLSKINYACEISKQKEHDLINFIRCFLPIAILIFIVEMIRNYGYDSFDVIGLLDALIKGINDIGAGYSDKVNRANTIIDGSSVWGGYIVTLIIYLWAFFEFNVLLLSIKFFSKAGMISKILTMTLCSLIIVFFIANGTNIGVFRIILAVLLFYYFNKKESREQGDVRRDSHASLRRIKFIFLTAFMVGIFIFYFSHTMMSRGAYDNGAAQFMRYSGMQFSEREEWYEILPDYIYYPFIAITSYSTQGLYGMSLALKEEWTPMFGIGSNMAVVNMLSKYFPSILESTYLYKIEQHYNWSSSIQWSSSFTWFANDVSFIGVVIVMYIIGMIMAMSFSDSINNRNPLANIVFYYMVIICLFLPGNNQIGQGFSTLFSMILALIWWSRSRIGKPYNIIKIIVGKHNVTFF